MYQTKACWPPPRFRAGSRAPMPAAAAVSQELGCQLPQSGVPVGVNQRLDQQRLIDLAHPHPIGVMAKYWEIIADNLRFRGWSIGFVSYTEHRRRMFCSHAHRDDGRHFIVRADDLLTAFLEVDAATKNAHAPRPLLSARSGKAAHISKGSPVR